MKGGGLGLMGCREEVECEGGPSRPILLPSNLYLCCIPSVCKLMVSPFFSTDNRRSLLAHLPSAFNFEEQEGGRKETRKEVWQ